MIMRLMDAAFGWWNRGCEGWERHQAVLRRDDRSCVRCGTPLADDALIGIHYWILERRKRRWFERPRLDTFTPENLFTACRRFEHGRIEGCVRELVRWRGESARNGFIVDRGEDLTTTPIQARVACDPADRDPARAVDSRWMYLAPDGQRHDDIPGQMWGVLDHTKPADAADRYVAAESADTAKDTARLMRGLYDGPALPPGRSVAWAVPWPHGPEAHALSLMHARTLEVREVAR